MAVTRRAVLEQLAAASDAEWRESTTVGALVAALDADEQTVEEHLESLEDCKLARTDEAGRARVTVTGKELLEIDADDLVIVDPAGGGSER